MSMYDLIFKNLKKNLKNYYLYVFALIFSVILYFSFVTLQYDPSMDPAKGSIKGAAGIKAASFLLIGIVFIFLLYANSIFIKRRSKEIGLLQLIGMKKSRIFLILSTENFILYFSSMLIGIIVGFALSKLIMMILLKITGIEEVAALQFSAPALVQTLIVFSILYLFIMLMNYVFIKRQSILSLFRVSASTEDQVRKQSWFGVVIGVIGILLIISGYYISSKLFSGDFLTMPQLFAAMVYVLGSVIIGTYLFYKGSVSFIFNMIRKRKDGYITIQEVLSLSSIMFRMKSNALLLTIITTVSALAIGLLSLSYISYYSAETSAKFSAPDHFSFIDTKSATQFTDALQANGLAYIDKKADVIQVEVDLLNIMDTSIDESPMDLKNTPLSVISDKAAGEIDVAPDETVFAGYNDVMTAFFRFKDSGITEVKGLNETIPLKYKGLDRESFITGYFSNGGLPTVIVDETVFKRLRQDINPDLQMDTSIYIGINMKDGADVEEANNIFHKIDFQYGPNYSQLGREIEQKNIMGLTLFIVGFLGLTFLIASGCILYFKQMGESEEEKPNYTILRKLGFTQDDLLKGIRAKQLFNFGIPLAVGLLHSYFAVQSGWFFFGTELWTPMLIVMLLYTGLYSIFGFLSLLYYKKIIKEAL